MDIYHSTYIRYIDLMGRLKDNVAELFRLTGGARQENMSDEHVFTLINRTIDTASEEKFLPTNELLGITKELFNIKKRMDAKTPAAQAMLKQCFRTLNMAAVSLKQITDDCALNCRNMKCKQ